MTDSWDHDLKDTAEEPLEPPLPPRQTGLWIAGALLAVAAIVAVYVAFGSRSTLEQPATTTAATAPPAPAAKEPRVNSLGGEPLPVTVPPLDEADPLVRRLVRDLSTHPQVAAWLATQYRIRNFAVVVTNIAEGKTPSALVPELRPRSGFRMIERGDALYLDPQTYERYSTLADAVESIDPAGSARLYATLKPRIEEAHRDLGYLDVSFDRMLERAIVLLLQTPVQDGAIAVEPRGIVYGFADAKLEELTPAQKQLLRLGPRNARVVQRKLREIALALGIPPDRLPASGAPARQ
jgi:hypothetical protein